MEDSTAAFRINSEEKVNRCKKKKKKEREREREREREKLRADICEWCGSGQGTEYGATFSSISQKCRVEMKAWLRGLKRFVFKLLKERKKERKKERPKWLVNQTRCRVDQMTWEFEK